VASKKAEAERERWNRAAGVVLAATRRDAGRDSDISQEALAELLGVTRNVIANIENGRKNIEVSDLIMIAKALKKNPLDVLERILRW
jgi:transcriptional regulator with XRE-family HTH domain